MGDWRTDPKFTAVPADGWVYLETYIYEGREEILIGWIALFVVECTYGHPGREPNERWQQNWTHNGVTHKFWESNSPHFNGKALIVSRDFQSGLDDLENYSTLNDEVLICRIEDVPPEILARAQWISAKDDVSVWVKESFERIHKKLEKEKK